MPICKVLQGITRGSYNFYSKLAFKHAIGEQKKHTIFIVSFTNN